MKWLTLPALWIAAAFVALAVLWRVWRRKPVVLQGKLSPRLIRMVVILLVAMGVGVEKSARAQGPPRGAPARPAENAGDAFPLSEAQATTWVWRGTRYGWNSSPIDIVKKNYSILLQTGKLPPGQRGSAIDVRVFPRKFGTLLKNEVDAVVAGKPVPKVTPAELIIALESVESQQTYDPWIASFLWRKSHHVPAGKQADLVKFYTQLQKYVRVTNTLIRAQAMAKPVFVAPRAWMSKAGPSRSVRAAQKALAQEVYANARRLFSKETTGTWQRDGLVQLSVAKDSGPVTLIRGGKRTQLKPGDVVRFGRLDILVTGGAAAEFQQSWLGQIEIPAGKTVSVWDLPGFLSKKGRQDAEKFIADALAGKELPGILVERSLPLMHALLRRALKAKPNADGAPRLRLMLSLFDDATMLAPKLKVPTPSFPTLPFSRGRGGRR